MPERRNRQQPAVPEPSATVIGLFATVSPIKEAVEMLQGQRGTFEDCAVTWGDLVKLGLITKAQVPEDVGQKRGG